MKEKNKKKALWDHHSKEDALQIILKWYLSSLFSIKLIHSVKLIVSEKSYYCRLKSFVRWRKSLGFNIKIAVLIPGFEIDGSFTMGTFSKCLSVSKCPEFTSSTPGACKSTALFLTAAKLNLKLSASG